MSTQKNLQPNALAAGNRTRARKSKMVMQEIKSELKKIHRDENKLHELISTLQDELPKADRKTAHSLRHLSHPVYGYIHLIQVVPTLRVVLLHEPLVRLYHGPASRDIIYFYATGVENLQWSTSFLISWCWGLETLRFGGQAGILF